MTDAVIAAAPGPARDLHTNDEARKRLTARYRRERQFKWLGAGAVIVSGLFLIILLSTIVTRAIPAFSQHYVDLTVDLSAENVAGGNFDGIVQQAIYAEFPDMSGRQDRRLLRGLVSTGAGVMLRKEVESDPSLIGSEYTFSAPLDDFADLYLKGLEALKDAPLFPGGTATPSAKTGDVSIVVGSNAFSPLLDAIKADLARQAGVLSRDAERRAGIAGRETGRLEALEASVESAGDAEQRARLEGRVADLRGSISTLLADAERLAAEAEALQARADVSNGSEALTSQFASYVLNINGGAVVLKEIRSDIASGQVAVPLQSADPAHSGDWSLVRIAKPESLRKISDKEIAWIDHLSQAGKIEASLNTIFLTTGASREPELAGIWGAAIGSALTMIVTMLLSFPVGVAAAIYLEEFAPKNRLTQLIEVNINNLAAVPSIVFGLLGLAVFLNWFALPRSAPLVGGMVLALMTLPTIIIASRAALRSVPPSIREAALAIGASKIQTVFHHVLPLAMPGIFTGTIIGMAQALGETAPLLMIGMVAFIVDIPGGFTDPSTVLPVQIYMWADFPEPGFQQKTSAAILILLVFLVMMNAVAVFFRRRFERRW
jgi:phosphate transport system permease protein